MRRLVVWTVAWALLAGMPTAAENRVAAELTLLEVFQRGDGSDWILAGSGSGRISLTSEAIENVRGELALDVSVEESPELSVARAFVKVRFPRFRTTVGKARVSWGEGAFFNAGDVVLGPAGSGADLTAEELRDEAAWMTLVFVPLGPFSFAEAIGLLADPGSAPELMRVTETSGGARFLGKIGATQLQSGYLYDGAAEMHRPYVALQGNLLVDWYGSATTAIENGSPDPAETLTVSWGLYHIGRGPARTQLTFRLEGLVRPKAEWQEGPGVSDYGILLYPELTWQASPPLLLRLRSFLSPIDGSGLGSFGIYWNVYQGLDVIALGSAQFGGADDRYGWSRPGGLSGTAGVRYIY